MVYLDDVIVYSPTFERHLTDLSAVFERIREAHLHLKPSKCHLFRRQVAFLGHVIDAHGIRTDPDKVTAMAFTGWNRSEMATTVTGCGARSTNHSRRCMR